MMQKSHLVVAIAVSLTTVFILSVFQPQPARAQSRSGVRVFEYKLIELPDPMRKTRLEEWLSEQGASGWEFPHDMVLRNVRGDNAAFRLEVPQNEGRFVLARRSMQ